MKLTATAQTDEAIGFLCDLLLEFAGRSPGRMPTARRHVIALDAALPHMTEAQQAEARRRILHLETRWGRLLPSACDEPEIGGIPPELRVARWLSTRKVPVRHLRVLHRAALKVAEGETSLSNILEFAFARETDWILVPVGLDSFKEWVIELRIARCERKGVYRPGSLCRWWLAEMASPKGSPAYRRCLELMTAS